jgi:multidrug efflux pump
MSQLLTLFTTPVIYLAFDRVALRMRRRLRRADLGPGPGGDGTDAAPV